MEAAKSAVNKIIHRGGQHDTHVEETVNPAVTQETVKPTRHENITEAVDKEVHQDHYHTTVQPIQHREVLPEQHRHQQVPVQEKEFRHGDDSHISRSVNAEAAQFEDGSRTVGTTHTQSQAPVVAGEHVHHHVHENVQPVIHKETVAPEVVHTTVPVHERHQAPSEHHGMSVLPTKTLNEVKNLGHSLTGGTRREEHYEGDPRKYNESMQATRTDIDKNFGQHDGLHSTDPAGRGGTTDRLTGAHERDVASGTAGRSATHNTNIEDSTNRSEGSRTTTGHDNSNVVDTTNSSSNIGNVNTTTASGHAGSRTTTTYDTTSTSSSSGQSNDHGLAHRVGHGITNQIHHGTERDNIDRNVSDSNVQHGTQSRDPAVVDDKGDKKLTGSGVDGSHSALFGLTPDGHKYQDTSHGAGPLRPAHSKDVSNTNTRANEQRLADQLNDVRVSEKAHGQDVSNTGSAKPGAGAPGGSQGFGNVRPEQHGTTDKIENKLDPTTDADGDGKRGVMD